MSRPCKYPKGLRKKQILEAARRIMLQKGLRGCTFNDLSLATGIPLGAMHHLCGSKELLCQKVLDSFEEMGKTVQEIEGKSTEELQLLRMAIEVKLGSKPEDSTIPYIPSRGTV